MKALMLLVLVCGAFSLPHSVQGQSASAPAAERADPRLEGIWEGYDAEWGHVSRQLVELAQAIRRISTGGVQQRVCVQ